MKIIRQVKPMQDWSRERHAAGVGLVPTMGYLHEGHLSLVDLARTRSRHVVLSLFVNPTQFAPGEDLKIYPRDFERDAGLARGRKVDVLFAPDEKEMYAAGHTTFVTVDNPARGLCGQTRPSHFRGVATVVAKLFNAVLPSVAVFGQKDAQQLAVIRRMVRDLHMPVEILSGPIVREKDGLAMSSRNAYLSPAERLEAAVLYRALQAAQAEFVRGERSAAVLCEGVRKIIVQSPLARIDYISIADPNEISPVETVGPEGLLALAVYFGKTRLIDNVLLKTKEGSHECTN